MEHDLPAEMVADLDDDWYDTLEFFPGDPIIYSYTAAQAEADGIICTIPQDLSREYGFRLPIRFTTAVMEMATPTDDETFQDKAAPILKAFQAANEENPDKGLIEFQVNGVKLWGCWDETSGPAIHIITPEEY